MKKQIVIMISEEQAMSILRYVAKYTPLGLFCHQPYMIGWSGHMTSLDSMTVSIAANGSVW